MAFQDANNDTKDQACATNQNSTSNEDTRSNENYKRRFRLNDLPFETLTVIIELVPEENLSMEFLNISKLLLKVVKSVLRLKRSLVMTLDGKNIAKQLRNIQLLKSKNTLDAIVDVHLKFASDFYVENHNREEDFVKLINLFSSLENVEIDNTACSHLKNINEYAMRFQSYLAKLILSNGKQIQMVRWMKLGSAKDVTITLRRKNEGNEIEGVREKGDIVTHKINFNLEKLKGLNPFSPKIKVVREERRSVKWMKFFDDLKWLRNLNPFTQ